MATLNRFPLLGLWAKEAAHRLGYSHDEAESLGHGYAVLYAIRAAGKPKRAAHKGAPSTPPPTAAPSPADVEELDFCGDHLQIERTAGNKVRGRVGGEGLQTPQTYVANIKDKFPADYYGRLEELFREVFKSYPPAQVNSRLVYELYDSWKKSCGVGRLVDLDKLIAWCQDRLKAKP